VVDRTKFNKLRKADTPGGNLFSSNGLAPLMYWFATLRTTDLITFFVALALVTLLAYLHLSGVLG